LLGNENTHNKSFGADSSIGETVVGAQRNGGISQNVEAFQKQKVGQPADGDT